MRRRNAAGSSVDAIVAGLNARYEDTDRIADFLDELGIRMFRPTLSRKSLPRLQAALPSLRQ